MNQNKSVNQKNKDTCIKGTNRRTKEKEKNEKKEIHFISSDDANTKKSNEDITPTKKTDDNKEKDDGKTKSPIKKTPPSRTTKQRKIDDEHGRLKLSDPGSRRKEKENSTPR